MKPLSPQNIESELSYAYLHAVAAHAGVGCKIGTRHDDNTGVDAILTGWAPFNNGGYIEEVDIKVQLKATIKPFVLSSKGYSYSFAGINQFNDLRAEAIATPRILVVLFLPDDKSTWLEHSEDALTLRNCAYWVSLRGAAVSDNKTAQTVYLPKEQKFDPTGLDDLMSRLSRHDIPVYEGDLS